MKIHEYQAKEIFKKFALPTPEGKMAESVDAAMAAADALGGDKFVVKAQVHAGGRGKAGGVKVVNGRDELKKAAGAILGMKLSTHQTGGVGIDVKKIYVEKAVDISKSLYMAVIANRSLRKVVLTACSAGDVEIEETARKNPELIVQEAIDPAVGLMPFQGRKVAKAIGLKGDAAKGAADIAVKMYKIFEQLDCTLVEVNPLVVTGDGKVIALDAKMTFDENAMYRHKDLESLEEKNEAEALEAEADEAGISYVRLDGNIGCLVNGAGLAMATMDMVAMKGGSPANFLDVGGGADRERVTKAFKIILSDPNVKVIFVNIFGGIVKCSMVAEGVVAATRDLDLKLPIVVCLKGTQQEEGRKTLEASGLNITARETMADGAAAAVALAKGGAK